jgi:hypothetical protein
MPGIKPLETRRAEFGGARWRALLGQQSTGKLGRVLSAALAHPPPVVLFGAARLACDASVF